MNNLGQFPLQVLCTTWSKQQQQKRKLRTQWEEALIRMKACLIKCTYFIEKK